jgi:hypothetical protein
MKGEKPTLFTIVSTGTRIRTQIKGFGDLYSTIELCPCIKKTISCQLQANQQNKFT